MNDAKDEAKDIAVLRIADIGIETLATLVAPAGLVVESVAEACEIPGSHWGDSEAGLIGDALYLRGDTPVHSALHEAGHWLLMDDVRRARLHTDAGGTAAEENAVCYLQILLSDDIPGMGRERMWADMDAWGYSFRLGSSRAWFESDAEDALEALLARRERVASLGVAQRINGAVRIDEAERINGAVRIDEAERIDEAQRLDGVATS